MSWVGGGTVISWSVPRYDWVALSGFGEGGGAWILDHDHGEQDEKEEEGKEDQEPSEPFSTRPTNQVEDPGPEEHIQDFDDEDDGDVDIVTRVGTQAVDPTATKVLQEHHEEGDDRDD